MRLADFIRDNPAPIVLEWENFAKNFVPAAGAMSPLALRDHITQILAFIVHDIEAAQSGPEQLLKSQGKKKHGKSPSAAEAHASLRHDGGFNLDQMVSEYRALRASIIKNWEASRPVFCEQDIRDLTRFHEAVDQVMTESIHNYSKKLETSRNLFLDILSHDLRNPLGAISNSAQLTVRLGGISERQAMLQSQIGDSADRALDIVATLLDLTRTRLGTGFPIIREVCDLRFVCRQLVNEMKTLHPGREFRLEMSGDLAGSWDKARLGQVLSNLLGNAVQYGFYDSPISISVEGLPQEVVLSVHNEGSPINTRILATLFDALTRGESGKPGKDAPIPVNLGLGLYISKGIVVAHGGKIDVTSTERDGTTFTVRLPRLASNDGEIDPAVQNKNPEDDGGSGWTDA